MVAFDQNQFTFDMEPYVSNIVKRVREVADEQIKDVLREAFNAGRAYGGAIQREWHGSLSSARPPNFEQWVADLIARNRAES